MGSFKDVKGHEDIIRYLTTALEQDRIGNAYIIQGNRGSGKKLLAGIFSAAIQCEGNRTDPCNRCRSCMRANGYHHPDILWLEGRGKSSIGVDDIRDQVIAGINVRPYQSQRKIFIIPQGETMTEQAQNALLKVIEEPPEYAVFLILTENEEVLLSTIRSRCVILKLKPVDTETIKRYLMEKKGRLESEAALCAAFSQGSLGRGLCFADSQNFQLMMDDMLYMLEHIKRMDMSEVMRLLEHMSDYRTNIDDCLDIMATWYRDVLLYKATKDSEKLVFKNQTESMSEQVKMSSYEGLEKIIEGIDKARQRLRANVNFDLTMELLILTMKEN